MEDNNQAQSFRLQPLTVIFVLSQIVLVLLLAFSIPKIFQNDQIKDTPTEGLSAKITNASDAIPENYSEWTKMIEWALLDTISENAGDNKLFKGQVLAQIRDDSIKTQYFKKSGTNYVRAIIDIPEYEQSYEIFLTYPDNPDAVKNVEYSNPDIAKPYSILCLKEKEDIIYPGFDCQESSNYFNRQKIVAKLIGDFNFEYFSAYFDSNDKSKIIISPSVTYNNSDAVKAKYIEEVKNAINSLGINPNDYKYYVRTAADVNYYN